MKEKQFRRRKANSDFNKKIKLELTFRRDLRKYFNAVKKRYANSLLPLPTIKPVLDNHYKRITIKVLKADTTKQNSDTDREKLKIVIMQFLSDRSRKQAGLIDKNTQKMITRAEKQLRESGVINPTISDIANVATRLNMSRVPNIATTETQMVFEGEKDVLIDNVHNQLRDVIVEGDEKRANKLSGISGDWESYRVAKNINKLSATALFTILAVAKKSWFTMLDGRVRKAHNQAEGQTVLKSQPFIVGGELLMYPGDTSLGASMWNIANCRCVAA